MTGSVLARAQMRAIVCMRVLARTRTGTEGMAGEMKTRINRASFSTAPAKAEHAKLYTLSSHGVNLSPARERAVRFV